MACFNYIHTFSIERTRVCEEGRKSVRSACAVAATASQSRPQRPLLLCLLFIILLTFFAAQLALVWVYR
jgi:hypothetical protein